MDETLILELSSDEEVGMENSSSADNYDWITKLFEDDPPDCNPSNNNSNNYDDDLDDVVVVGEVIVQKSKKPKSLVYDDDADDDCVVLDGDPDKAKDEKAKDCKNSYNKNIDRFHDNYEKDDDGDDDDDDDDDLLIVGEKGQVACRDFPHARHSCAKYPFSSTAHESSCDLCHCYVCDSLAPCAHWGSGVLSTDHCHATDKEEYWKNERTRFREQKNPSPLPIAFTKHSNGSLPQSSKLHQSRGPNQLLRRSISGMSSTSSPRYISRRQKTSLPIASNRSQPNLISRQLLRCVNNGNIQIQGNRGVSVLPRTRMITSRPSFKRPGVTSSRPVAADYQPAYHTLNNVSVACLDMSNQQLTGQLAENNSTSLSVSSLHSDLNPTFLPSNTSSMYPATSINLQGYSHPSAHTLTSQYQGYNFSSGLASDSNPSTFAPMNQSRNVPDLTLPLHIEQQSAVIQNVLGPTPDGLSSITHQSHQTSEEQSCYSPFFSSTMTNAWNSVTPSCQQSSVESSVAVPMHELLPSIEQNKPPSVNDSEPPLYFDMDYWLQDDGPVLGSRDESFMLDVNNQASGPAPVDAGMLYFDFETSMQGLTHS